MPDDVAAAYGGGRPKYGPEYIIPVPFDPRLIYAVPAAVAKAAMETGRCPPADRRSRRLQGDLRARLNPVAGVLARIFERARRSPKRIVFAEGEEEQVIRAAQSFVNQGLGTAILVGREDRVRATASAAGIELKDGIEIANARLSNRNADYANQLYERLQRQGYLFRDCQRLVNLDRNVFAAAMVAAGDADGMVTGVTRNYSSALDDVRRVIDPKPGHRLIGASIVLSRGRTVLVADTAITEMPSAQELAEIAIEAAHVARRLGTEPRVALLAYSTFGHPKGERSDKVIEAVRILDSKRVDFEYDGEMAADVALNRDLMQAYPFCRLSGPANVLVMPAFHSASISTKMMQELAGATVIGPLLVGLDKPVQDRAARRQGFRHRQHGGTGRLQRRRLISDADRGGGEGRLVVGGKARRDGLEPALDGVGNQRRRLRRHRPGRTRSPGRSRSRGRPGRRPRPAVRRLPPQPTCRDRATRQ